MWWTYGRNFAVIILRIYYPNEYYLYCFIKSVFQLMLVWIVNFCKIKISKNPLLKSYSFTSRSKFSQVFIKTRKLLERIFVRVCDFCVVLSLQCHQGLNTQPFVLPAMCVRDLKLIKYINKQRILLKFQYYFCLVHLVISDRILSITL